MNKFNVGDRVTKNYYDGGKVSCLIIELSNSPDRRGNIHRYKIRKLGIVNCQGTDVETWTESTTLELDKEYYRNIKLDELLE